jgi:hypothetical protein
MPSSGLKNTSIMNSIAPGKRSSVSVEETNQHSLAGWKSTPLSRLWGNPGDSRSSKLLDINLDAMADMKKVPGWKMLGEFVRSLVVASVLAHFVVLLGAVGWMGAVQLGVWVWIGFPVMILVGSVQWENVPWKLAAIHAGDWLVKLLLMAVILGAWR